MKFEILLDQWTKTDSAIVLADGRLGYLAGSLRGVALPPLWRHSEETTRDPKFRELCFQSLEPGERDAAIARAGTIEF